MSERDRLIAIACRIVDSRAVAEELVQESWIRWHSRSYPTEKATPVFRSIVMNLARDWRRRSKVEASFISSLTATFDDPRDAERIVIARQEVMRIVSALEELDPRVVLAFRLHRFEGRTLSQIAKELDTVPSRIHSYVVKALTHLTFRLME
ncbi:MAG: sigma-70 family RNA polymerase sigma factor [Pseudomonadota bacterium]